MVRGLVGKHAAIQGMGAAPGCLIIIGLGPAPADANRAHHKLAEAALAVGFHQLANRQVVAVLLDDEEPDIGGVASRNHRIGIRDRQRHRLLDQDMLAVRRQRQAMGGMVAAFRQNADDVDLAAHFTHHLVHVGEPGHVEALTGLARHAWQNVAYGDKLRIAYMLFSQEL